MTFAPKPPRSPDQRDETAEGDTLESLQLPDPSDLATASGGLELPKPPNPTGIIAAGSGTELLKPPNPTGIIAASGGLDPIQLAAQSAKAAISNVVKPVQLAAQSAMAAVSGAVKPIQFAAQSATTAGSSAVDPFKYVAQSATTPVRRAVEPLQSLAQPGMAAVSGVLGSLRLLEIKVASGDDLDVRQFSVQERLSSLFTVSLVALSKNPDISFDDVVGQPAHFTLRRGQHTRTWSGLCNHLQQIRVEESGLSTYELTLVPTLWLLTQRRNHRMFQQSAELDIVKKLLTEWDIKPEEKLTETYKPRKYRVQYGESDYAFMSRMLEDAGITFILQELDGETKLVLSDAPQLTEPRAEKVAFRDNPTVAADKEHVTAVRISQRVRPGRYTMRDHDYRRAPSFPLLGHAETPNAEIEAKLERFHYTPGAFLFRSDKMEDTPVADDKGKTRADDKEAAALAKKRLEAKRATAKVCTFETNAHDLAPGVVMSMLDHPKSDLGPARKLLILESSLSGTNDGEWSHHCEAVSAEIPYHPELTTPKPKVNGVESATVVGPPGEEIHCDEFGRVRVHFHWDRESKMDDNSSCWIHVSQSWAGAGYGGMNLPRIDQEVLVDFLGGDPDRPVIVGRVYTNLQKVPYKLPDNKTQSGWKSNSTGGKGGYNEIMFEDAQGKELLRIQAEKNLTKLVKNDETATIRKNRSADIGQNDTSTVGIEYSVTIAAGPTSITMSEDSIVLTTSGATIELGADTIELSAREISLDATESIFVHGAKHVVIDGDDAVLINCTEKPPPDEIEMPSTEDEFVDEMISLFPPGRAIELGAKLIFGKSAVDAVKGKAAEVVKQGADAAKGALGVGGD